MMIIERMLSSYYRSGIEATIGIEHLTNKDIARCVVADKLPNDSG
jgi:hypothetical protein